MHLSSSADLPPFIVPDSPSNSNRRAKAASTAIPLRNFVENDERRSRQPVGRGKRSRLPRIIPATKAEVEAFSARPTKFKNGFDNVPAIAAVQDAIRLGVSLPFLKKIRQKIAAHPFRAVGAAALNALSKCPVLILSSPTGSGKTTGFPIMAMFHERPEEAPEELRYASVDMIVPRRGLASETAHYTSSHFFGEAPGGFIGINTGRTKLYADQTRIIYQTTGTAWMSLHPRKSFKEYTQKLMQLPENHVFVLDEFHERQIHVDVLLGIILKEMRRRIQHDIPCFRLVISSATLDPEGLQKQINELLFKEQPAPRQLVATVIATHLNGSSVNPNVDIKFYRGQLGDFEAAAAKALELAQHGENVLLLAPNITIQREIAKTVEDLIEEKETLHGSEIPVQVHQVSSRSTDRERAVLTGKLPKGQQVIAISTVSRSGGTYPGITALVDPLVTTRAQTCFLDGVIPIKAQVLELASKSAAHQGIGRMGRCPRTDDKKDIVALPLQFNRQPLIDYPIPDILDSAELGSTLLSLSTTIPHGHHAPNLFNINSLLLLQNVDENKLQRWRRFLELIGAVSNQGFLTKLGLLMREVPGSLETRKLVALAQQTESNTLAILSCICASIVENEGLLNVPGGRAPIWSKKEFNFYRSDFLRELDYFFLLKRVYDLEGERAAAQFCARNDLSLKSFERVLLALPKLYQAANIESDDILEGIILTDLPQSTLTHLHKLIQEAYLHTLMRRPSTRALWMSALDSEKTFYTQKDAMVAGSDILCLGQPVARLWEDSNGEISPESDNRFGKLYWTTGITHKELKDLLVKYPGLAEVFGDIQSYSIFKQSNTVKTHGSHTTRR